MKPSVKVLNTRILTTLACLAVFLLVPYPIARWAAATAGLYVVFAWVWAVLLRMALRIDDSTAILRSFSGHRTTIDLKVENRGLLPSGVMFVFDSFDNLETWGESRFFLDLSPLSYRTFSYDVRGRQRGLHRLGPLQVQASDPAGLFGFTLVQPYERQLLLYPPLNSVSDAGIKGSPPGEKAVPWLLIEDVSRFRSFRDFEPGDELSKIAASLSAQRGTLTVRTWEKTAALSTAVLLDFEAENYPMRKRWVWMERAIEAATAMLWYRIGLGDRVWLTVAGRFEPWSGSTLPPRNGDWGMGKGWESARSLLELLALVQPIQEHWEEGPSFWYRCLPPPPARLYWISASAPPPYLADGLNGYELVFLQVGPHASDNDDTNVHSSIRVSEYGEIDLHGF